MTKSLIVGLFFLSVSCSPTADTKDLIGIWTMHQTDTIEIKTDGTFVHHYAGLTNSGKWKLNSAGNEIDFDGFSWRSEHSEGHWYSRISRDGNEIHLVYASDTSDGYYKKTEE
jgi:hypothetical protein